MRLYDNPIPVDSGRGREEVQTASLTPVEGPRTPYRGYTYTVTPQGREFVWRVYEELGDDGILLKVGSVVSQGLGEGAIAAEQSAKDWIDNYIDELGALQPGVSDDEGNFTPEDDEEKEEDPLDPGVSGEFILIGALAFLALAVVFIFDGED
mgnify:CR=1 FL=1